MKHKIFIDSNMYLRFYDSNAGEYKKLLQSLEEIKDKIFVTSQIQHEVERNKLNVFLSFFKSYGEKFKFNKISFQEHLDNNSKNIFNDWNAENKKIEKDIKNQKNKLEKIVGGLIDKIINNSDQVSQILEKIFLQKYISSEEFIERGRKRKETGNPPGKKTDTLGDQITWEQLLDDAVNIDFIWIISNDGDYIEEFNNICYLNTFLYNELKLKNPLIKINCYKTLGKGLSSFNHYIKISSLPKANELKKITKQEETFNLLNYIPSGIISSGSLSPIGFSGSNNLLNNLYNSNKNCPKCGSKMFTKINIGYSSMDQYYCKNCEDFLS